MKFEIVNASSEIKDLYKVAVLAREKAYCPYSGYKVGAAIRLTDHRLFSGCNVENASFGATICAERVAILKAISETGQIQISELMVVTQSNPPWPPCGICRQMISEFGPDVIIYSAGLDGIYHQSMFSDLFPQAFTATNLIK